VRGARIFVEGSVTFRSNVIARLLEHCPKVAVFVLTIGDRLGEMVHQLSGEGFMVQAAVLDAIGSDAAETLAHVVQDIIRREAAAEGLGVSLRFSPGYCDWRVSQQKMVFRAMAGDSAGVRLTDGCLMVPQKSISGIIGIGPADRVESYNPCLTCNKRDCIGRR
jgi:cobalamin-dependent methionine synthase I